MFLIESLPTKNNTITTYNKQALEIKMLEDLTMTIVDKVGPQVPFNKNDTDDDDDNDGSTNSR